MDSSPKMSKSSLKISCLKAVDRCMARSTTAEFNMTGHVYHEKQSKELCLLHALNNLFQDPDAFRQSDLDNICYELSPETWVNPHKSMLGLGNYDVNVLSAALQTKNCDSVWFDKRKDPSIISLDNVIGFILNVPSDFKIGWIPLPLNRKHWIAIRFIGDQFYNLDSKLDQVESVGQEEELLTYLRDQLSVKDKELFLIVQKEVAESELWRKALVTFQNGGPSGGLKVNLPDSPEEPQPPSSSNMSEEPSSTSSKGPSTRPNMSNNPPLGFDKPEESSSATNS